MKSIEYKIKTHDGSEIQVYEWIPEDVTKIKGIVQIAHGLAEHAMRYKDFAEFLTNNGFAVFADDHRGHGKTAGDIKNVGYFGPKNGWANIVSDMKFLSKFANEKYPNKAFFIFGHSLGSFLSRNYIIAPGFKLSGAIFSGTAGHPGLFMGQMGILITKILMLLYPIDSPSKFANNLSFGSYNNAFKPNRTKFDWLSRDNEQVDKYIQDPYCGNIFSVSAFNEMAKGLVFVNQQKNIDKTPEDLPILLFAGDKDPVGNKGKGVDQVYSKYKKAGVKDINLKLFTDGRHEMLNEINKEEVYRFIISWLSKYC